MRTKSKNQKADEKLVEEILEKIRSGKPGLEEKIELEEESVQTAKPRSAKRLKELRALKEKMTIKRKEQKIHQSDEFAQNFIENMREAEERAFNEMMEEVNADTEMQRVNNLVVYLRKNRKRIPERLVINLNYFPYLQKYYLMADAEIKHSKVNGRKLGKGYFKFLPAPKTKATIEKSNKKAISKRRKKIAKIISSKYYIDVINSSAEESEALNNLLKISPEFKKLYQEFQKIK